MFENISNESIGKTKRNLKYIKRFTAKYLTFWIFQLFVFYIPIFVTKDPFYGFYVTKSFVIMGIAFTLLLFFSLNRLANVYNDEIALRFINSEAPINTLKEKLTFIFSQKENRLELIIFAAAQIILPSGFTSPCFVWLFLGGNGGFGMKLLLMLGLLPVLTVIYILSNLSAIKYWNVQERKKITNLNALSERERMTARKADGKEYKRTYRALLLGYFAGSLVFMLFIPQLLKSILPFLLMFASPSFLIIAIIAVCIPFAVRTVKVLRKRKKFVEELKAVCKRKRYVISKISNPYKSLFSMYKGESFNVRIGDRKYSCKLIAAKKRNHPLYILPKGIGAYLIKIRFLSIDLFSYTKSFSFGWEADCKKVIIVNPVPISVLRPKGDSLVPEDNPELYISPKNSGGAGFPMILNTKKQSNIVELDNGDIIDGYELYTATAFLNALERDVIDID